ncbi:MAG: hypothetical protein QM658_07050 [Gordonia sp. (in: high G+C Gram-positive bacteria)]
MTPTLTRRARRRAGSFVAVGAAAALIAGVLAPAAPAKAALVDSFTCEAGSNAFTETPDRDIGVPPLLGVEKGQVGTVDCRDSQASVVGAVADRLLGILVPDLPVGLGSFNRAVVLVNPAALTPTIGGWTPFGPTNAKIKGSGYTSALAALSADSSAQAQGYLSAALAIAATGGTAVSTADFLGLSVASAIGANAVDLPGLPSVKPVAKAHALPGGVAIAVVTLNDDRADVTALGGVAMATSNPIDKGKAVCTAVYAAASVKSGSGANADSCTGVLFVFQQYQTGNGPVWYAIKNPLDVGLVSPMSETLTGGIAQILQVLGLPAIVADGLSGKVVPEFKSDVVRISFVNGTPKVESDLGDWLDRLLGGASNPLATTTSTTLTNASAKKVNLRTSDAGRVEDPAGDSKDDDAAIVNEPSGFDGGASEDTTGQDTTGQDTTRKGSDDKSSDDDKGDDDKEKPRSDDSGAKNGDVESNDSKDEPAAGDAE